MKLPARREYPEYYEVIRRPMDINKIVTKIDEGKVSFHFNYSTKYYLLKVNI